MLKQNAHHYENIFALSNDFQLKQYSSSSSSSGSWIFAEIVTGGFHSSSRDHKTSQ